MSRFDNYNTRISFPHSLPNNQEEDIIESPPEANTITTTNPNLSHVNQLSNFYLENQEKEIREYFENKEDDFQEALTEILDLK
ncbi:12398_t:CDS:2 [Dentiscutata heterogama]|uniref:12398_t:CDS:1 n=1 Tax=Dentiscutata heterogama TaxID=1316150 RepID=A0ACA9M3E5_9GLOM|nr:12398_t:CDS:2 [Dentiscutata heterogama]